MKNLFSASVSVARLGHDEPVLGERHERLARFAVEPLRRERRRIARQTIEQAGDIVRDNELRVRERVHQEHFSAVGERDTNVKHRLLHMFDNLSLECVG